MLTISIFIVDDHKVFRQGIQSLLDYEEDIEVIGTAGSIQEFTEKLLTVDPDIILLDITLKDGEGPDFTKWILEQKPTCKVLIFSMHQEDKYVKKVLASGAHGFLLKDAGTKEMIKAIRTVYNGETFYSNTIMQSIVTQLMDKKKSKKNQTGKNLTKRELQVLKLIAEEKSNKEIADSLFISTRTVDAHRRNLLDKLQAKNTASLVKYAIRLGLIDL